MDTLSNFGHFATIIGLICSFKSINDSANQDSFNEFFEYLIKENHQETLLQIENNSELTNAIKKLLQSNHSEVINKLISLEEMIVNISAQINGIKEISHAIHPNTGLSKQAFSILEQLYDSKTNLFVEIESLEETSFHFLGGIGTQLTIKEPRFVNDDLKTLCELGLLIPSYNNAGERLFEITRASANLAKSSRV